MSKRFMIRRWLPTTVIAVGAFFLVAATQVPAQSPKSLGSRSYGPREGDPQNGKNVVEAKCAACHGADGNSIDPKIPKLAAQNPAYLYWQLWGFRTGARKSEIMSGIVSALSDGDMADAASFFGRQTIRPDSVVDPRLAGIGQRIYSTGVGRGMMSSCAMCHGTGAPGGTPGMMGRMPMMGMMGSRTVANIPNLKGQHATYIIDQLNRFANGERQGQMMNHIARALTQTDKIAVAEFLSGVP